MMWNWQHPDWPNFAWKASRFAAAEQQFLVAGGTFVGAIKHLGEKDRNQLTVDAMSTEAVTTSEIEGEILDRANVQSSIQRQLGLAADNRRAAPAECGVAEMMVNLYETFAAPLSDDMLFEWHGMLMGGRQDLTDVGSYRTSTKPMQIVSGATGAPKIHFEVPPSAEIPSQMKQFITWFNRTAPGGRAAAIGPDKGRGRSPVL
jgi:Fic family protein